MKTAFFPPVHPGLHRKSIFPAQTNKQPAVRAWGIYADRVPTNEEFNSWSTHQGPWALVTGEISGIVVLDFDGPVGITALSRLRSEGKLPATWKALTPRGGVHLFYAYPGPNKLKNAKRLLDGMDVKADRGYVIIPSEYNDGRSWEVPPTTEPPMLPDWVWKQTAIAKRNDRISPLVDGLPRAVKEGERNDRACSYAGRCLRKGNTPEETFILMREWNRTNTPPLDDNELRACLNSIVLRETIKGNSPLQVISAAELVNSDIADPEMIIPPFFPEGSKAILAAWGGTGKTLLALNMAVSLANELPMFQRWTALRKHKTLYLDAESSRGLTKGRIKRIAQGLHGTLAGVELSFPQTKMDLGKAHVREQLCREIEAKDISLVIFDSFLCFADLRNENDNTETRAFLEKVGEIPKLTGAAVMLIDHAGKPSAEKYRANVAVTPRGASAKNDWADLTLVLEERKHEARVLRTLSFSKTRYCPRPPSMVLEMDHNYVFVASGEDELCPVSTVAQVVGSEPGITTNELVKRMCETTGCSTRSAYRGIARARELRMVEERQDGRKKRNWPQAKEQPGNLSWERNPGEDDE
jgi:hypothetical protein